jgi:hypothetical protein
MRRPTATLAAALALALVAAAAGADTVRLRNGRAYEGVIAEEVPGGVRIRLAFGHLVLPAEQVLAIEKSPSALAEFLARRAALEASPGATAADWIALARWSRGRELAQGTREAALAAADLDPRHAGLEPLLRPFGLVLDGGLGRWIPFDESMARKGLVRDEGEWITVGQQRERQAERDRLRVAAAQEASARRMAAAAEAMERTARRRPDVVAVYVPPPVIAMPLLPYPVYVVPPVVVYPEPPHPPMPPPVVAPRHGYGRWSTRAPGSLLPPPPVDPGAPATGIGARSSG